MSTTAQGPAPAGSAAAEAPAGSATAPSPAVPAAAPPKQGGARRKALAGVTVLVLAGAAAWGAYWALVLNHHESTDNAYVQGRVVQITPQVAGTVVAIEADDTDRVTAGQVMVRLDPADAQMALDQASAQLAQTVREVRTLFANNSTLSAQVALREADLARARADLARAQDDVNRRAPLVATGAVGREEFNHSNAQLAAAKSMVSAAQSAVTAAREQLAANRTLTDGVSVDDHPNVLRAAARVREAWLATRRNELRAPVDGQVARRSVQLGQRIAAGTPLMSVVALDDLWVDANFKEGQLRSLRIGQPVELTADVYGSKTVYHGTVAGLGAGTGAAFSLLPAQNASGNWIKVVQRVPVRINLDPRELARHPLRIGLSMEAVVDVARTDGPQLAAAPVAGTGGAPGSASPSGQAVVQGVAGTPDARPAAKASRIERIVDVDDDRAADEAVRRIIAANGGGLSRLGQPPKAAMAAGEAAATRTIR